MGENAKREGEEERRKKKIKVITRLWLSRRTIDHQSGLNVLQERSSDLLNAFFFFFLNLDRKTERTEETEKLNKINRERMEKTKKKKKRRTKEDYDKLTEPNVERKKY